MTTNTLTTTTTFTRDAVENLSLMLDTPPWLQALRLAAFDAFERLPMPTERERAWKYYDPNRLRLGNLHTFSFTVTSDGSRPEAVTNAVRADERRSGLVVQQDSGVALVELDPAVAAQGVIVAGLNEAATEHENLVRRHLASAVRPD